MLCCVDVRIVDKILAARCDVVDAEGNAVAVDGVVSVGNAVGSVLGDRVGSAVVAIFGCGDRVGSLLGALLGTPGCTKGAVVVGGVVSISRSMTVRFRIGSESPISFS